MWCQKTIFLDSSEQGSKTIFTNGLAGCIALAYMRKSVSGARSVTMSHYPSVSRPDQINSLRLEYNKDKNSVIDKTLIILVPGVIMKNLDGN